MLHSPKGIPLVRLYVNGRSMCKLHSPTFDAESSEFSPWLYLWPFLDQEEAIYK